MSLKRFVNLNREELETINIPKASSCNCEEELLDNDDISTSEKIDPTKMPVDDLIEYEDDNKLKDFVKKVELSNTQLDNRTEIATTPIVVEPIRNNIDIIVSSNNNKEWNDKNTSIEKRIDKIITVLNSMLNIVRKYQYEPEAIDDVEIDTFRNNLVLLNSIAGMNVSMSTENSFENYVETMNKVLSAVADNIDGVRNSISSMLTGLIKEILEIDVDKYRKVTFKVMNSIKKKNRKTITLVDHLLEAISKDLKGDFSIERLKELVKHHEYLIRGLTADDEKVINSSGSVTWLTDKQVDLIATNYKTFINILQNNKILYYSLKNKKDNVFSFIHKQLPELHNICTELLAIKNNKSDISDANNLVNTHESIETLINNKLADFIKLAGYIQIGNKVISGMCCKNGFYGIEEGKVVEVSIDKSELLNIRIDKENDKEVSLEDKEEKEEEILPNLDYEYFVTLNNTLNTTNLSKEVIVEFINNLNNVINSKQLEVTDTDDVNNILVIMGSILGIANIFRNNFIYGLNRLNDSLSELICAYYNILVAVDSIDKIKDNTEIANTTETDTNTNLESFSNKIINKTKLSNFITNQEGYLDRVKNVNNIFVSQEKFLTPYKKYHNIKPNKVLTLSGDNVAESYDYFFKNSDTVKEVFRMFKTLGSIDLTKNVPYNSDLISIEDVPLDKEKDVKKLVNKEINGTLIYSYPTNTGISVIYSNFRDYKEWKATDEVVGIVSSWNNYGLRVHTEPFKVKSDKEITLLPDEVIAMHKIMDQYDLLFREILLNINNNRKELDQVVLIEDTDGRIAKKPTITTYNNRFTKVTLRTYDAEKYYELLLHTIGRLADSIAATYVYIMENAKK